MPKQKTAIEQVAKSVDDLAKITKEGFEQVDKRFEQVDKRFEQVDKRFEQVGKRFEQVDKRLTKAGAMMVTKDYLDEKLHKTKGDIISVIKGDRERDRTFKNKLLEIIQRNKLASKDELELMAELIR